MKLFCALFLLQAAASSGQWIQVGNDIDGENENDFAGGTQKALSMNGAGTTIAVGSTGHDGSNGINSGHTRIFDFDGKGLWLQRGLDIEGELADDNSGESVVLSEDGMVVAIGEPFSEAGNDDRFAISYGQVRVFEWNSEAWVQRGAAITGDDKCDFAASGGGLAMDAAGTTVVVGAATHDVNGLSGNEGQVRVYGWDGANWVQQGSDILGKNQGDWFGQSVSINGSGDTIAAGAIFDNADGARKGSVGIFDWNNSDGAWLQRGNDIDGEQDYDFSGTSLAMNNAGDMVVIGSPQANAPYGHPKRGAATVFEWNQGEWQQRGSRIEGEADGDRSGSTVEISDSGDTIAIGAPLSDGSSETEGHVRVYDWDGSDWSQRGDDIDGETFDYSGFSIDMSSDGNKLASGARFTDEGGGYFAGNAKVFSWNEDTVVCEDDDEFRKGNRNQNCEGYLRRNAGRKCRRPHQGKMVFDFCRKTCGDLGLGDSECAVDFDFVLDRL